MLRSWMAGVACGVLALAATVPAQACHGRRGHGACRGAVAAPAVGQARGLLGRIPGVGLMSGGAAAGAVPGAGVAPGRGGAPGMAARGVGLVTGVGLLKFVPGVNRMIPFGGGATGLGAPGVGLPGRKLAGGGLNGLGLPGASLPGVGLPGASLPGVGVMAR